MLEIGKGKIYPVSVNHVPKSHGVELKSVATIYLLKVGEMKLARNNTLDNKEHKEAVLRPE